MKNIFQMLLSLMLINLSCKTLVDTSDEVTFKVVTEDKTQNADFPEEGYYYEYQFTHYSQYFHSVEDSLRSYIAAGIELLDAWYQHGSTSCHPPNSSYALQVIVYPVFIVRTKTRNDYLSGRNFQESERPKSVFCGYYGRHYMPRKFYYEFFG